MKQVTLDYSHLRHWTQVKGRNCRGQNYCFPRCSWSGRSSPPADGQRRAAAAAGAGVDAVGADADVLAAADGHPNSEHWAAGDR